MTLSAAQRSLNIKSDYIPKGSSNRPGTPITPGWITIHATGNSARGADALAHARYLKGADARARQVSWHYTVDDLRVVKHLPTGEMGWHTGKSQGNRESVGIEICQHEGIDQELAIERAAVLAAVLCIVLKIDPLKVVPHLAWTGKACPGIILKREGGFARFRNRVGEIVAELKKG